MSSLQNGMRPERTSSMAPWYSPRQASAKAGQSSVKPKGLSIASASRAIEVRQSTRVPNTSKNRAFTAMAMGHSSNMIQFEESDHDLDFSLPHDLIRKPVATFRDHALARPAP